MSEVSEQLYERIDEVFFAMESNPNLRDAIQDFNSPVELPSRQQAEANGFSSELVAFYEESNGYTMSWAHDDDATGKINIARLEHVTGSWEGNVFSADEDEASPLRKFHPVDLFVEDACCGVMRGEGGDGLAQRMYLLHFGASDLHDLELGFPGYMKLAIEARGFRYWQSYILALISGQSTAESQMFKVEMPKLFEDFRLAAFDELFETERLR